MSESCRVIAAAAGTECKAMAAVLTTLGFECYGCKRVRGGAESWRWSERSACGRWSLGQVVSRWNDEAWLMEAQESPLAYAITSVKNLCTVWELMEEAAPYVKVCRGGRSVLLRQDAAPELLSKAQQFLK